MLKKKIKYFKKVTIIVNLICLILMVYAISGVKAVNVNEVAKLNNKILDTSISPPVHVNPANGSTNVPIDKTIKVTFPENIKKSANFEMIYLKNNLGNTVSVSKDVYGSALILDPRCLGYKTTYTITIPANSLKLSAGNEIAAHYAFRFTTAEADGDSDRYEPNNNIMAATRIGKNAIITDANLDNSGDIDYYKFFLNSHSNVTIDLSNISAECDYELWLYNSSNVQKGSSTSIGNKAERIAAVLDAGTYYIKINSSKGCSGDYYNLEVASENILYPDKHEPNDGLSDATGISAYDTISDANIHELNDVDYYQFYWNGNSSLNIGLSNIPVDCNYNLKLYNSLGSLKGSSTLSGNASESLMVTLDEGTYYIKVYSDKGYSRNNYKLQLTSESDAFEPNNSTGDAYAFYMFNDYGVGDITFNNVNLNTSGDIDYYKFTLDVTSRVGIGLSNIPSGCNYDLKLYDESISEKGSSTLSSDASESITTTLAAGTYYIKVYSSSGYSSSFYNLRITSSYDVFEPNNTSDYATEIWLYKEGLISNSIIDMCNIDISSDVDFFKFTLETRSSVKVKLSNIPSGCNYDLKLYDDSIVQKGASTLAGNAEESIVKVLDAGTYYIKVNSYSGYSDSFYKIQVTSIESSPDVYETNNVKENATDISMNSPIVDSNIDTYDDIDYYSFVLSSRTNIVIGLSNIPTGCNYDLELYNSSDTQKGKSQEVKNFSEAISTALDAGVYYIKVYSSEGCSSEENYILQVTSKEGSISDKYEPNNTASFATNIDKNALITDSNIDNPNDVDYFKFTLDSNSNVNIGLTDVPNDCWYTLMLYDSTSKPIYNYEETKITTALNAGTYYVRVYSNNTYSENCYSLNVTSTAPTADKYEVNNTSSNAKLISGNTTINDANLHTLSDVDYFKLNLSASSIVTLKLENIPDGCNYYLDFFDSKLIKIKDGTDICAALNAGTYYIKVYSWQGCSNDFYNLSVNLVEPDLSVLDII